MTARMQSLAFRVPGQIALEIEHRADVSGEHRSEIARDLLIKGLEVEQREIGHRMILERLERIEQAINRLLRFLDVAEAER